MVENTNKKGKVILDFVIKSMNGMAYGLFATLIVDLSYGIVDPRIRMGAR